MYAVVTMVIGEPRKKERLGIITTKKVKSVINFNYYFYTIH
jgi:hypothetical protein